MDLAFNQTKMQVLPAEHKTFRSSARTIFRVRLLLAPLVLLPICARFTLPPHPQEHGFHGFFSGVSLRIVRKGASSAIGWSVYEGLLLAFREREERQRKEREV